MRLSCVILTHSRRDALLHRLIACTSLMDEPSEVIVMDNASTDGTAGAVAEAFGAVRLIRRRTNDGSVARNSGVSATRSGSTASPGTPSGLHECLGQAPGVRETPPGRLLTKDMSARAQCIDHDGGRIAVDDTHDHGIEILRQQAFVIRARGHATERGAPRRVQVTHGSKHRVRMFLDQPRPPRDNPAQSDDAESYGQGHGCGTEVRGQESVCQRQGFRCSGFGAGAEVPIHRD